MKDAMRNVSQLSPAKRKLLEKLLQDQIAGTATTTTRSIPHDPRRISARPTFAQQQLWFLDQLEPGDSSYNVPVAGMLKGPLDLAILHRSLQEIIKRHAALRTRFISQEGQPQQVIDPYLSLALPLIHLGQLSTSRREEEIQRLAQEEGRLPFDLIHGPLIRATLLRAHSEEHILCITFHHIIVDNWSAGLFLRELTELYENFAAGKPSALFALPLQYIDFAVWQQEQIQDDTLTPHLDYWRHHLAGSSPQLHLPSERARPPVQSHHGAQRSIQLPQSLSNKLKRLSQSEGTTLFMTLLAAFQTLLYRYSGQTDILVGTDIANRSRPELEQLIGFFVNTVVMRTDLSGNLTFRSLLSRVRAVCTGAYEHQDLPFEQLVLELQPERTTDTTPFFQVFFTLQESPQIELHFADLTLSLWRINNATAKFDLSLDIVDAEQGLQSLIEYNTDLFHADFISRLLEHWQILLENIVANPDQRLAEIAFLTAAERQRILYQWNNTDRHYDTQQTMHHIFAEQARITPDALAVVDEKVQLSYKELDRLTNLLAQHLCTLGIGPESLIGIYMERSVEIVVGQLAIFKAGGAYVPLDPAYPVDRLALILADGQLALILTQPSLIATLPPLCPPTLCLEPAWQVLSHSKEERIQNIDNTEHLAYVIYTSGSTGQPKGAMVTHKGMLNHLYAKINDLDIQHTDVIAQTASQYFDISVWQSFAALIVGGKTCIIPDTIAHHPSLLFKKIITEQITLLEIVPSLLGAMLEEQEQSSPVTWPDLSIRWLIVTGETLPPNFCQRWLRLYPAVPLVNAYGPTECSDDVTHHILPYPPEDAATSIPIGTPIANTQLYILDERLSPVPQGIPGQLYVAGAGVGRGYLNDPIRTAEKFIPNCFGERQGDRLYQTGDKARYLADGTIEFLGRLDYQVKVRGFRIEPGEIEAALTQHPALHSCVVVARETGQSDKLLVAYIMGRSAATIPSETELRQYLAEKLPHYMLPSLFVPLETLPLTPNGKVDRQALPVPQQHSKEREEKGTPARNPIEIIVADIWQDILNVEHISIHDNFFTLGGHSLLATQLLARIQTITHIHLSVRELFEKPTVAGIAEHIEKQLQQRQGAQRLPLAPQLRPRDLPLSFAQQRLWFLDQLEPASTMYLIPQAIRLRGTLDVRALDWGIKEIRGRHESLRTTFHSTYDQPIQSIGTARSYQFPLVDLSRLQVQDQDEQARMLAQQEAQTPFDLTTGPLLRVGLLRLNKETHILLLTMHHIIADAWSMDIFMYEMVVLYNAFQEGKPSPLSPLPIQYADYTLWQRQWLQGDVLTSQLKYWTRQLAALAPLELLTDTPRPLVQTYNGARQNIVLSTQLRDKLKQLARREGATLFMTLLAAFQTLLARYSGQTDIAVGTPIANRHHEETNGLIGFFVNLLVLRGNLAADPTFLELLQHVREVCLEAYAHQDIPFEKLVEVLQPERDTSRSPLFQVMFLLEHATDPKQFLHGLSLEALIDESETTKYDLTLAVIDTKQELFCGIEYNTDLFASATIARILEHWQTLLEGIVNKPEQHISMLPLLPARECHQILTRWNATSVNYPTSTTLHTLFEEQAVLNPDRIALIFKNEQITYADLNLHANQLAHFLQKRGIRPDTFVGICMERSIEMVIGLLGILKAGAAYVPLDPSYPQERLQYMLEDSQITFLITQHHLRNQLPPSPLPVMCLDTLSLLALTFIITPEMPPPALHPEQLAYMIYTSGSTGMPKGAMNTHQAISNRIQWMQQAYHLSESDRVLQKTPFSFDVSVWEFFWPLATGACLVVAEPGRQGEGAYLVQVISEQQITTLHFVPSMLHAFLQEPYLQRCTSLRQVICSGEALSTNLQNSFFTHGLAELHNLYGPTEAAVDVTAWKCEKNWSAPRVPIGYPIANLKLHILDAQMQPVPIGVAGELYIGGIGLARGYWNRPGLTAEKFLPDPFSQRGSERLYKTGDSACYRGDGSIDYLGRLDYQVKIRGFRIEPGEIEAILARHPQIQESIVIDWEMAPGDKHLVAYLVGRDPAIPPHEEELRTYLQQRLPGYMVPSFFVALPALPLTPNGKANRRALPAPQPGATRGESIVPPRTPVEQAILTIYQDVLGHKQISMQDTFFALGGHSLLATQILARIRAYLQVDISLRSLFEEPTPAGVAKRIESQLRHKQGGVLPSMQATSRSQDLPLSFAQQRLWFLDQLEPQNSAYTIVLCMRLHGKLNMRALASSLQEIVQRHEVLHTTFQVKNGVPLQIISTPGTHSSPLIDLTGLDSEQRVIIAQQVMRMETQRPFSLSQGPLFHTLLIQASNDEHYLLVSAHHAIFDGWSTGLFLQELHILYNAFSTGKPALLPALPIQYADYAFWQRQWLQGEVLEAQVTYWKNQLSKLLPLDLPTDYARPAQSSHSAAYEKLILPTTLQYDLKQLSQQEGTTLFMTLVAAFQVLLSRYTGQYDIAVGTPIANRGLAEIEKLIGFFVNTLVLRTDLTGDPTFQQVLAHVRQRALEAYANQDVPFEKLVELLQPERDLNRSPLFQVMFILQHEPQLTPILHLHQLTVEGISEENGASPFDLSLAMADTEEGLHCMIEYDTDLFTAATIRRFLGYWQVLLAGIIESPAQRISTLPILPDAEMKQVLIEWNATQTSYPTDTNLHTLFERQATQTPDRVALSLQDHQLTYAALDNRTNQLAHHLQQLGVTAETLVGIYMERSIEAIIAIIAIFKAGGAYVPLDPAYPEERLELIVNDARVRVVLTVTELKEKLPAGDIVSVCLDAIWQTLTHGIDQVHKSLHSSQHLAYVIYTSGSTGRPKGAMIHQDGMINHLYAKINDLELREADVVAQTASHCFDISVWQFLAALLIGGRVQILSDDDIHDPLYLYEQLLVRGITILELVPSLLRLMLDELKDTEKYSEQAIYLRWLVVTGEVLPPSLCQRWLQIYQQSPLVNAYGPTECSDDVTHARILYALNGQESSVPIGTPIANTQIYILDRYLTPVPIGVPGQLYVGGIGVGRGYLYNPERTATTFLPDPFCMQAGSRLYNTGDLARYLPNGAIEFLGRVDHQVKIRGYRIELGEIETALQKHTEIRENVVLALDGKGSGGKVLVAYIVLLGHATLPIKELRDYMKGLLPDYMVPSLFIFLPALPLTPNGKIDRAALPLPDTQTLEPVGYATSVRSPLEEVITAIWEEVLKREAIGIHDNFFEIGGHSLLATQVSSRLRTTFHVEIPVRTIFEAPTIAELVRRVENTLSIGIGREIPPIIPVPRQPFFPLSFAQQRLWFIQQLDINSAEYNMANALRLRGELKPQALQRSIEKIIHRHEILRTTFSLHEGLPVQVIHEEMEFFLPIVDISILPHAKREDCLHQLADQEAIRPFDLTRGPLLRAHLLRLDTCEHALLLTMHHIISDGWSSSIFVHELSTLYNAFAEGEVAILPEILIQYVDFVAWQRQWLQGEVLAAHIDYWTHQLAGASPLELPTDHPRPEKLSADGSFHSFTLSPQLSEALMALSRQEGATLFTTLLATFQTLLYRYTGQQDILVGTDIANRISVEIEQTLGFFINLLVLRTDLNGQPTFREVLMRVRKTLLEAYAHQDLPFEKLIDEMQLERSTQQVPLVRALFVLQNAPTPSPHLQGLEFSPIENDVQTAKFELAVFMMEQDQRLTGVVNYRTDLFEHESIIKMFQRFEVLLSSIVNRPEVSIDALELYTDTEKKQAQQSEEISREQRRRKLQTAKRNVVSLNRPQNKQ